MKVPSSIPFLMNVETGIVSPCCLFIGSTISLTNSGMLIVATASSLEVAVAHEAGTSILTIAFTPASIAALFMFTTFSPFLP